MQNPFSTVFISPGKLEFVFSGDDCRKDVSARLAAYNWRAQILGPHGSGKTTLLRNLTQELQSQFEIAYVQPREFPSIDALPRHLASPRPALFAIDGLELLPKRDQKQLLDWAGTHQVGLLITTHQPVALPILYRTQPISMVFQQIVQQLLGDAQSMFTVQEITRTFEKHKGNIREALFEMYDKFEEVKVQRLVKSNPSHLF